MKTERGNKNIKSLKVPFEFCQYVIKNKLIKEARLLVMLKFQFKDITKIDHEDIVFLASELGYKCPKQIRSQLKRLIELNWIGYNFETQNYFIRGIDEIRKLLNFTRRQSAEIGYENIKKFKLFAASAVMRSLNNNYRRKLTYPEAEGNSGPSLQANGKSTPISNEALSIILGVSLSTAFQFKKDAAKAGFINLKKMFKKTPYKWKDIKAFIKGNPELAKRAVRKRRHIYLKEPDHVESLVIARRRKKIELY
jgi:hypothetical protein